MSLRSSLDVNADVLDIIIEYCSGAVRDACSLRAVGFSWRMAVDSAVRRYVLVDQPEIQRSAEEPLYLLSYKTHLDAVRIAFTCDKFAQIARLVVVAFALDGAKDELREGGVCGPRPVVICEVPVHGGVSWVDPAHSSTPRSLRHCLRSAYLDLRVSDSSDDNFVFSALTQLTLHAGTDDPQLVGRNVKLLRAVGPQLTHLLLWQMGSPVPFAADYAAAISACSRLRHFKLRQAAHQPTQVPSCVCDALLATCAPLEHVGGDFDKVDLLRLLDAVPTIVAVETKLVSKNTLPVASLLRLEEFNGVAFARSSRRTGPHHNWPGDARFVSLDVLCVADLAGMFPQLEYVEFTGIDEGIAVRDLRFPASLTSLSIGGTDAYRGCGGGGGLLEHIARAFPDPRQLSRLRISTGGTSTTVVDFRPLVVFGAATLRELVAVPWSGAQEIPAIEAALAQLVGLETVDMPSLPTARCFLGGGHSRLRRLRVGSLDAASTEADDAACSFGRVVKACPRLCSAEGVHDDPSRATLPHGWESYELPFAEKSLKLRRLSFG